MSGVVDIDGTTLMCGPPPLEARVEEELRTRRFWDWRDTPGPLKTLVQLKSDVPAVQRIVACAHEALRLAEAGQWAEALVAFRARERTVRPVS